MQYSPKRGAAVAGVVVSSIGIGITVAIAFAGYVVTTTSSLGQKVNAAEIVNSAQGERLSSQEATSKAILDRLDRIDRKLDTVVANTK